MSSSFTFSATTRRFLPPSILMLIAVIFFTERLVVGQAEDEPEIQYTTVSELRDSYDFIVIGAGVAGSVVATRLAVHETHPTVLLMEAGRKAEVANDSIQRVPVHVLLNQLSDIDWQYKTVPQQFSGGAFVRNQNNWPRGKVFGGSGVLNYMMYVRGHKSDWNIEMHNLENNISGWQYDDVLPFFKKTETVVIPDDGDIDYTQRGNAGPMRINFASEFTPSAVADEWIKAAMQSGYPFSADHNDGDLTSLGVAYTQYNINQHGLRMNTFLSYMYNLVMADPGFVDGDINLDLLPRAHATQLLFTENNNNSDGNVRRIATGVRFVDLNTKLEHVIPLSSLDRGEVIVSAGTINSPQLLMLSGMGPSKHLSSIPEIHQLEDIPGVGANLQDHVAHFVRYRVPTMEEHLPSLFDSVLTVANVVANPNMAHTPGVPAQAYYATSYHRAEHGFPPLPLPWTAATERATAGANLNDDEAEEYNDGIYPDIQFNFVTGFPTNPMWMNMRPNYYHSDEYDCGFTEDPSFYADLNDTNNIVLCVTLHHPQSRGAISLQSADPFEYPLMNPNYFQQEIDLLKMVEGVRELQRIFDNSTLLNVYGLREIVCSGKHGDPRHSDASLKKYIRDFSTTLYHPCCTCKYGNLDTDEMAVVSDELLLKYTQNVRVIDLSVMPYMTSGNTQLPTAMIAEKGVHHVLQQWERAQTQTQEECVA